MTITKTDRHTATTLIHAKKTQLRQEYAEFVKNSSSGTQTDYIMSADMLAVKKMISSCTDEVYLLTNLAPGDAELAYDLVFRKLDAEGKAVLVLSINSQLEAYHLSYSGRTLETLVRNSYYYHEILMGQSGVDRDQSPMLILAALDRACSYESSPDYAVDILAKAHRKWAKEAQAEKAAREKKAQQKVWADAGAARRGQNGFGSIFGTGVA